MSELQLTVVTERLISAELRDEAIDLCTQAFEEDYRPFMDSFEGATHILGFVGGRLVSHALWVTRWLKIGENEPLRTAYVEAMATDLQCRGRGYARAVMEEIAKQIQDYEIGGLAPFDANYYARLGWELWQGPLFERKGQSVVQSAEDEELMVYRLPKTPELDLIASISIEWREGEVW